MLEQAGRKPSILTRGYKRRSKEACIVIEPGRERQPASDEVGDEPALMARRLTQVPLIVARDRYSAGRVAESRFEVDVHLLDDGFQHLHLYRDIDVLVIDATQPFASGQLLPSGRLRERPEAARRADLIVITRGDPKSTDLIAATLEGFGIRRPIFTARTRLLRAAAGKLARRVARFAFGRATPETRAGFLWTGESRCVFPRPGTVGIFAGRATQFFRSSPLRSFRFRRVLDQARRSGAEWLLTTEKDVQNMSEPWTESLPLFCCSMELEIPEEDWFRREIFSRLDTLGQGKGQ